MSWIWTAMVGCAILCAAVTGNAQALSAAALQGASQGISLALSMAGAICLWSGVGKLMEAGGISKGLSRLFMPVLKRLFPSAKTDPQLAGALSGNICANLLGLGNAATPLGIQAVKQMKTEKNGTASHEMCRLIVLNTASIQLIPANVAAIRASLGAPSPFDILPAVWITSFSSAGIGLLAAWLMGKAGKGD